MSASNFLSRWSRLKREAGEKRPLGEGPAATDEGLYVPSTPRSAENDLPVVAELPPEELAKLPPIEDFTAETEVAPFLRHGIPSGLRNAALRKMWALDPAIRDRVGDALDYAYDWNVPGGVPGAGPLLATDDVQAMLRSIMGGVEAEPGRDDKTEEGSGPIAEASPAEPPAALSLPQQEAAESSKQDDALLGEQVAGRRASAGVAEAAELRPAQGEAAAPRRHGGAKPF
jgi:hypothetical protein